MSIIDFMYFSHSSSTMQSINWKQLCLLKRVSHCPNSTLVSIQQHYEVKRTWAFVAVGWTSIWSCGNSIKLHIMCHSELWVHSFCKWRKIIANLCLWCDRFNYVSLFFLSKAFLYICESLLNFYDMIRSKVSHLLQLI